MVAGILYLNSARANFVDQRSESLRSEAQLIDGAIEVQMPAGAPVNLITGDGVDVEATLTKLPLRAGTQVQVIDTAGNLIAVNNGAAVDQTNERSTPLTDALSGLGSIFGGKSETSAAEGDAALDAEIAAFAERALSGETSFVTLSNANDETIFAAASVLEQAGRAVGVVVMTSAAGEVDALVREQRERVLQMFVIATLVSVGLSLILASTIANPLADLASAAEIGGDRKQGNNSSAGRIRIPDLTARPDEIGRLSGALRGMVSALYNRIDSNEQFAADVAHEIKNPLASLRSAVGTMRVAKRDDQRERLLEVIEHDVRRLDRLVSDISNASRLDSELVKEEQEAFDLVGMLGNLGHYLGEEASKKGIDFITDFPDQPIVITGLEGRLAQVFVNLITNAISFCEDGDAIRLWTRKRENRVLIVVEDTGPGIPDQALTKVFQRFYSERLEGDFGNNSGLGLAISKQIVEAHDGVIWAENIRPTDADITSDPLGARFVVGLPV